LGQVLILEIAPFGIGFGHIMVHIFRKVLHMLVLDYWTGISDEDTDTLYLLKELLLCLDRSSICLGWLR